MTKTIMALAVAAQSVNWGEGWNGNRLELAGQVTLIGMLMIFAVLTILWGVLAIFKFIFARTPKKTKTESKPMPEVKTAPAPEAVPAASSDDELVAVITAAVAAYRAAESPDATPCGFRVVSYRRTSGGRAWNSK